MNKASARCLRTPSAVSPGNDISQFLLMTRISVVNTGVPRVAWWKACKCEAVFCQYALLAVCCICMYAERGCVSLFSLFSSGMSHRFVTASRLSSIIILLFLITCTSCFPNSTWQPASHNTSTDMRDLSISLNACPCCAVAGRSGDKLSCLVVVEFIVVLLAHSTPN